MRRPKITITQKVYLDQYGHYRFYNIGGGPDARAPALTFNLELVDEADRHGHIYPQLDVRTEKELAWFLLTEFGEGEYKLSGHLRGKRGSFTFWEGQVSNEGWMFPKRVLKKSEDEAFGAEALYGWEARNEAESELQEDIRREMHEEAKRHRLKNRYGFEPFLKRSGKRGEFHAWDEPDDALIDASTMALEDDDEDQDLESKGEEQRYARRAEEPQDAMPSYSPADYPEAPDDYPR